MITDYLKDAEKRFERKFMSPDLSEEELIQIIKNHPLMFSEIFHERYVNSIYLDTFDLKNYWNISGSQLEFLQNQLGNINDIENIFILNPASIQIL